MDNVIRIKVCGTGPIPPELLAQLPGLFRLASGLIAQPPAEASEAGPDRSRHEGDHDHSETWAIIDKMITDVRRDMDRDDETDDGLMCVLTSANYMAFPREHMASLLAAALIRAARNRPPF